MAVSGAVGKSFVLVGRLFLSTPHNMSKLIGAEAPRQLDMLNKTV